MSSINNNSTTPNPLTSGTPNSDTYSDASNPLNQKSSPDIQRDSDYFVSLMQASTDKIKGKASKTDGKSDILNDGSADQTQLLSDTGKDTIKNKNGSSNSDPSNLIPQRQIPVGTQSSNRLSNSSQGQAPVSSQVLDKPADSSQGQNPVGMQVPGKSSDNVQGQAPISSQGSAKPTDGSQGQAPASSGSIKPSDDSQGQVPVGTQDSSKPADGSQGQNSASTQGPGKSSGSSQSQAPVGTQGSGKPSDGSPGNTSVSMSGGSQNSSSTATKQNAKGIGAFNPNTLPSSSSTQYKNKKDITSTKLAAPISGDAILNGMGQNPISINFVNKSGPQATSKINTEIASQILASLPDDNKKQDVMITFKDGVLPNTSVKVTKDGDTLSLVFNTTATQSANLLNQNESALRAHLQNALGTNTINIKIDDESLQRSQTNQQSNQNNQNNQNRGRNVFDYEPEETKA